MRSWKLLLPLLASTLCLAQQPDRITAPINSSQMVALRNHVSPLAQPRFQQGLIEPSRPLNVTMLFTPTAEQQGKLQKLLDEQQDHESANFHKWLTPEQYADRFGLSQNDINSVTAWLQSQGFKVVYVARGRDAITFSGDAAQVQSAFKTEIHSYDENGKMHFANSIPPMIPAALSGIVGGFRGLHNFFPHPQIRPHPDYSVTGESTHFIAPGDLAVIYNINPLYQLATPIDGTNQKLVVVGQTDIYLADINDYRGDFGLSTILSSSTSCAPSTTAGEVGVISTPCNTSNFQLVISGTGGDPGLSPGDVSESDLDIEVSGSIARNAQIIFVTSSGGVNDSWSWAIDQDLAPVISISYGLCEAFSTAPPVATEDEEFQKAASMGISVFAAAGDAGAAMCDGNAFGPDVATATLGLSVSYPASSPEVTGMGGTEFNEGSSTFWGPAPTVSTTNFGNSALSYIPELAWNDTKFVGTLSATGGGPSNCEHVSGTTTVTIDGEPFAFNVCDAPTSGGFAKPSYQTALTPSDGVRDVPDISFSASDVNDPYIVCTPQSEIPHGSDVSTSTCVDGITTAIDTYSSAFGGTSASTPLAAGMAALLNQYLGTNGLGNLNTQLYKLYGTDQSAFHNITTGTSGTGDGDTSDNIVPCTSGDPSAEPLALRCTSTDSFGYSVVGGASYSSVTGLGSIDFDVLFPAWKASLAPDFKLTASALNPISVSAGQQAASTLTISPVSGSTAMTVNFAPSNCTGLPTGATCAFNPTSVYFDGTSAPPITLTISTLPNMAPSGPTTITITPTNSSGTTTTVNLTVTATTETFTLTTQNNATTFPVAVGGTAAVSVNVNSSTGFIVGSGSGATTAIPVTYTCTGTPSLSTAEISCQISPGSGQPTNATAITVNLGTIAPTSQLRRPFGGGIFYALLLPGLFGIIVAAGSRTRGLRLLGMIVVLGFSTLWLGACGGSGGGGTTTPPNPGSTPGTYTVTINGTTGGANPVTSSLAFTLTVTQ
jgi:Pro-kumamolisin, activation domain